MLHRETLSQKKTKKEKRKEKKNEKDQLNTITIVTTSIFSGTVATLRKIDLTFKMFHRN